MQNRNMFPYRRQGPKKRNKNAPPRRPRGPQKGLPNSARDLLPMLQPATKALANMLAGNAGASGQFGHAQALAAQAERLIGERAHNRLNPSEREEFFEQVARLKLTIADAEAEAEAQERDEPVPPPVIAPVARERLREMAMAFAGGPGQRGRAANGEASSDAATPPTEPAADETSGKAEDDATRPDDREAAPAPEEARPATTEAARNRGGRLQLSNSAAQEAAVAVRSGDRKPRSVPARERRAAPPRRGSSGTPATDNGAAEEAPDGGSRGGGDDRSEGAEERAAPRRARAAKSKGLPEGWVIDEEGYVVPDPS